MSQGVMDVGTCRKRPEGIVFAAMLVVTSTCGGSDAAATNGASDVSSVDASGESTESTGTSSTSASTSDTTAASTSDTTATSTSDTTSTSGTSAASTFGSDSSIGPASESSGDSDTSSHICPPFDVGPAPYPSSPAICGIVWDRDVSHLAEGSDNWAMTWADDGDQYTAYGDGWGFDPMISSKLSLGLAKVTGDPPNPIGINIRSVTAEHVGDGPIGKKTSGMLFVDGSLYMLVRNANLSGEQCQVARSDDHALTWTWSSWTIPELGYCAFLNFGQAYAGAIDGHVYAYASDDPSAYDTSDQVVVARVPSDSIMDRATWEFASEITDGTAKWSSEIADRVPVFEFPMGCNRLDVTYDAALDRYLMTMRARSDGGGIDHFSVYDAPTPFGPWTTVFYTESWDVDPGEVAHIPSKWIGPDGTEFHLVFAGNDSFAVRRGVLQLP